MNIRAWKGQRGDILLDAMVGLLIVGFVYVCNASGMASITNLDAKNRYQADAIYQLDNLLQVNGSGLCSSTNPNITLSNGVSLPVTVSCTNVVMTVPNGYSLSTSVNQITLTVNSTQYFGSLGQIKIVG